MSNVQPYPQPPQLPPQSGSNHWPWSCALMFLVFCVAGLITGWFVYHKVSSGVGTVVHHLAGAFTPNVQFTTKLYSSITDLKADPKLVVLTTTINVEITEEKTTDTLWGQLPLGTTTVHIRAYDNKVQYYIPLTNFSVKNFQFDAAKKRLIVTVPKPILDEEMVAVQSDPAKLQIQTSLGWSSFDRFEGEEMRNRARSDMRPAVLEQGRSVLVQEKAQREAKKIIRQRLLAPLRDVLKPDVKVGVQFEGENADDQE